MKDKENPYIAIPNPYEEYKKNMDEFTKNNPEALEVSRLCYEVFEMNEDGKKLLELYEERFIFSSLVNPMMSNASEAALYWSGFTDCIKGFKRYVSEHQQRITSCQKQKVK